MSQFAFRRGQSVRIGPNEFQFLRRMPEAKWQLENAATGEWRTLTESELLDLFATGKLSFISKVDAESPQRINWPESWSEIFLHTVGTWLRWRRSAFNISKNLIGVSRIAISRRTIEPLIGTLSEQVNDEKTTQLAYGVPGLSQMGVGGPGHTCDHFPVRRTRQPALLEWLRKSKRSATR